MNDLFLYSKVQFFKSSKDSKFEIQIRCTLNQTEYPILLRYIFVLFEFPAGWAGFPGQSGTAGLESCNTTSIIFYTTVQYITSKFCSKIPIALRFQDDNLPPSTRDLS